MESKFIKVPFAFSIFGESGPQQQFGVLFDVKQVEPVEPEIKIRSVGFCGMDVQRFLSEEQLVTILDRCRLSLAVGVEAVDTDTPTRDNVDTSQLQSDFT